MCYFFERKENNKIEVCVYFFFMFLILSRLYFALYFFIENIGNHALTNIYNQEMIGV